MKKLLSLVILSLSAVLSHADAAPLVEGRDYKLVPVPQSVPAGTVEVREFFWYGCPHCAQLDPHITAWLKTKPAGVTFIRTPAPLNPVWESNARGFYVAEQLGQLEASHTALFDAIHVKKERPFDQAALAEFYARFGIAPAKFNALYNSFSVSGKVAQARDLVVRYQLSGVPATVVNGKYLVSGSGPQVIETVKALIAREQGKPTR